MSLIVTRFGLAEYKRSVWTAMIPVGTAVEELSKPEYWAHIAAQTKTYDRIEAQAEDGSFWIDLLVIKAEKSALHTRPIHFIDLKPKAKVESADEPFFTKFRGPRRWSVLRASDKAVMVEDIATEDEANTKVAELKAAA